MNKIIIAAAAALSLAAVATMAEAVSQPETPIIIIDGDAKVCYELSGYLICN